MLKKIIITIIVFVFVGGAVFFMRSRSEEQSYIESEIMTVDVHKTINMDATMNPDVYADITSELPTLISSVEVSVNDIVEEGRELFTLDKKSIYAQLNNAKLTVERAELAEKQARRKWDALKPEERESIKKATMQSRQILNEVYAQAAKTTITSPIDGVIVEQNARVGEIAQGIVIKIIDPKSLQVEVMIPEVDIAKVTKGDKSSIVFDAYPNKIIEGTFASMDLGSTVDQNNTYFKAIVDIDDRQDITILDGMNAEVDIEIEKKTDVVAVSRDFAQKDESGYFVYVLNNGNKSKEQFTKKYFEAGIIGDDFIEVAVGMNVGDVIVMPEKK